MPLDNIKGTVLRDTVTDRPANRQDHTYYRAYSRADER